MKVSSPEDDTVQKTLFLFFRSSFLFFSRNKSVHLDPFFKFQNTALAVMFSGCNDILDATVRPTESATDSVT